jgi:murein tripeptide amidase MpaA
MDELAAANDFVEVETIGQSHQGRDLKVLKINTANAEKKFWIDGGALDSRCRPNNLFNSDF